MTERPKRPKPLYIKNLQAEAFKTRAVYKLVGAFAGDVAKILQDLQTVKY
ncbi:MAG: hypothetical protein LBE91_08080 [Tannerella sp.]|nr:hypothetical protein [Tannerella sp.]